MVEIERSNSSSAGQTAETESTVTHNAPTGRDPAEVFSWIQSPFPTQIRFLPLAARLAGELAAAGHRDGVEDGGDLVGVYLRSERTAIVTNVLRGQNVERSAALLDSTADSEEMTRQFAMLDRLAGGHLMNLGRIHRHPGAAPGTPSSVDRRAYQERCVEGELAGMICPIMTTSPKLKITGWIFRVADDTSRGGFREVNVGMISEKEFLDLFSGEATEVRQAAEKILGASRCDVARIAAPGIRGTRKPRLLPTVYPPALQTSDAWSSILCNWCRRATRFAPVLAILSAIAAIVFLISIPAAQENHDAIPDGRVSTEILARLDSLRAEVRELHGLERRMRTLEEATRHLIEQFEGNGSSAGNAPNQDPPSNGRADGMVTRENR